MIDQRELGYVEPYDTTLPTFHVRKMLFFQRQRDGRVRITKMPDMLSLEGAVARADELPPGWPGLNSGFLITPEFDFILTASEFASIVADMSLRGETGETYREALTFLEKKEKTT